MRRPRTANRVWRRTALGLAVAVTVGTTLAACGGPPGPPPASQGLVLNRPTPETAALVDQRGGHVSLSQLKGKVVVLAPFLTLCQDECPLILASFIQLKRAIDAAGLGPKVAFVEVTVDPQRDTAARLLAYQHEFDANWDLWTGSSAQITDFWKPFGISYQMVPEGTPAHADWWTGQPLAYDVAHTDGYILIDAKGHERFVDTNAPVVNHLTKQQRALLDAGGLHNATHPNGSEWTVSDALHAIGWLLGAAIPVPAP